MNSSNSTNQGHYTNYSKGNVYSSIKHQSTYKILF